jgi:hypothetical protein
VRLDETKSYMDVTFAVAEIRVKCPVGPSSQ